MREDHRSDVREKLINRRKESTTIDEILINRKLKRIYEKLDAICDGQIIPREAYGFGYKRKDSNKILDVKNISTGLKTFVILKTLLINGTLERKRHDYLRRTGNPFTPTVAAPLCRTDRAHSERVQYAYSFEHAQPVLPAGH